MPTPDPTFQHSDEDWTQITQPRLRKRVQNRVSQRKHRNKIRQQRANSIDAEQILSPPQASTSYRPPHNSLASDGSSHRFPEEHKLQGYGQPQQQLLDSTLSPDYGGFEAFDYTCFGASDPGSNRPPWVDNLPSTYTQPSNYSTASSLNVPSDYPQDPHVYGRSTTPSSKRPSVPASVTSSTYTTGMNGMDASQHDLPPQWHQMSSVASTSPYCTDNYSAGPSPVAYPHHSPYTSWQPQRTCEYPSSYTVGDSLAAATKPSSFDRKAQNPPSGATRGYGTANVRSTAVPASNMEFSPVHDSREASKPLWDDVEAQGSGINPTYYQHCRRSYTPSNSHQPRTSRR
ncbi:MAG: hypothetical protein Q9173_005404 [Seirophora scorigena]